MKKSIYFLFILLISCSDVDKDRPANLIGEEQMAQLIFELSIIDASQGFVPEKSKKPVRVHSASFYAYHEIDSLQFNLSSAYYAKHPKQYLRIVNRSKLLLEELEKEQSKQEEKKMMVEKDSLLSEKKDKNNRLNENK
ncbi:MAG: DUF4296 domain-containing protein [Flavobacteriaceae bacterium]|nr:DUF4296 domain-containing protein [Flavobacteriaceae bacterium]